VAAFLGDVVLEVIGQQRSDLVGPGLMIISSAVAADQGPGRSSGE
jgi:hypothetical protein